MTDVDTKLTTAEKAAIFTKAEAATPEKTVDILVKAGIIVPKAWWTSLGINGSVVSAISGVALLGSVVLQMFGYSVDIGVLTEVLTGFTALVVAGMTWIGRVRAVQPISMTQVAPGFTLEEKP